MSSRLSPTRLAFPLVVVVLFEELIAASPFSSLVALAAWPTLVFLAGRFDRTQRSNSLWPQLVAPLGLFGALWLFSAAASSVAGTELRLSTLWALPALAAWRLLARVLEGVRTPLVLAVLLALAAPAVAPPVVVLVACLFPFYLWGLMAPRRSEARPAWWRLGIAASVLVWSLEAPLPGSTSSVAVWLLRAAVIHWGLLAAPLGRAWRWSPRRAGAVSALWLSAPMIAAVSTSKWLPPAWLLAPAAVALGLLLSTRGARRVLAWYLEWCEWLAQRGTAFDLALIRSVSVRTRRLARRAVTGASAMRTRHVTASTLLSCFAWAVLLLLAGEWASGMHESPGGFILEHPRAAAITVAILVAALLVIDSIKAVSVAARPAALLVFIVLGLINREKLKYLSVPLYTSDLELADHVWALLPSLVRQAHPAVLVALVGSVAAIVLGVLAWRRALAAAWRPPPRALVVFAALLLLWIGGPSRRQETIAAAGLKNVPWDPVTNARTNGFLLTLGLSERVERHRAPPLPDDDVLGELLERLDEGLEPAPGLDLVMVMSESLWDVEALAGVQFGKTPMPTLRQRSGSLFSPSLGGGTANVEFEALTGFSTAFLAPNTVPYQHAVYRRVPSLMWALKSEGYHTVAVHPYHRWFWRRQQVYEHLGFDRFIALDEMPNAARRGPFASDDAMVDEVLARLEQAEGPTALFAVSMQNHGPYEANRYETRRFELQGNLSDESRAILQTYVEGVLDANLSLERLMNALRQRARPSLLVFFGDHAPSLGGKHEVYLEGGAISSTELPLPLEDYVTLHRTPLLIWRSDTNEIIPMPQVSPSLLPSIVCELLRVDHPYYARFLTRVRREFDVVERRALHTVANGWALVEDAVDENPLLEMFHAVQHDVLFGSRILEARLFPEFAPMAASE